MKLKVGLLLLLVLGFVASSAAQDERLAAEKLDKLRLELIDLQTREESLRARLKKIDEDLKPENIERALAGIGSTRPEALRESRRRELTAQREITFKELTNAEERRRQLESEIYTTEVQAYHESAQPISATDQLLMFTGSGRWPVFVTLGFLAALLIAGVALVVRRIS